MEAGIWQVFFLQVSFLDGNRARSVIHNIIEAHVKAYDMISATDDIDSDGDGIAKFAGFSHLMVIVKPVISKVRMEKNKEAAKRFSYFINDYFVNAVVKGEEDLNYLNTIQMHDENSRDFRFHEEWKNKTDFIGLNYYRSMYVYQSLIVSLSSAKFVGGAPITDHRHHKQPHGILNDLGWEIYPSGLFDLIMKIHDKWKIPIFVTENGMADKDDKLRAKFIVSHLRQLQRAMKEGARIIGYLHWSLLDNYEWQEAYDPKSRFGLFTVDRQNRSYDRHVTKGAKALKLIIEKSSQNNEIISDVALNDAANEFGEISDDGISYYS